MVRLRSRYKKKQQQSNEQQDQKNNDSSQKLSKQLKDNVDHLKQMLGNPDDLKIREFSVADKQCAVAYIAGLVDNDFLHNYIMKDLQVELDFKQDLPQDSKKLLQVIEQDVISATAIQHGKSMDEVSLAILSGETIVYLDGVAEVLMINTTGGENRSIEEPQSEGVLRGPRDGFVENFQINLSLVRRRLKDPNLRIKTHKTGKRSKKTLAVIYIEGIVHPNILTELNKRLKSINIDDPLGSGAIEQWIEDSYLSPFPLVSNTERPDVVENAIINGRIAIIVEGTPFALIVPTTIGDVLKSPEDYYNRWTIGSLIRFLRYFAAFLAIFLPSLYVALTSYHVGLIPSALAFFIAASREGVPFSSTIEAFLMVTTLELLREAGARLPKAIGQTIGIVGGLVIGEAAVSAGIVSPIMIIVVALNAIASFAIPDYSTASTFRILLYFFLIAASILGLYGIILAYIMLNIHIVNLKSFGIPYSAPFSPGFLSDWRDLIFKLPVNFRKQKRPIYLQPGDKKSSSEEGGNNN